jgi:hypothetical protein
LLVWDYDRIWGSFNFGAYNGMLMVDHGPQSEPPNGFVGSENDDDQDQGDDDEDQGPREPVYFDFTWRGYHTANPNILYSNPDLTKGRIAFDTVHIRGFFKLMGGGPDYCQPFEGGAQWGPRRVPRSLESFIDEWNETIEIIISS